MIRTLSAWLAVFSLTFAGCESPKSSVSPPAASDATAMQTTGTSRPAESPAAVVTLDIKSWDETLELVAQHKGKVVVLDLWSTSCDSCMEEFPHLVALHKQHGDKLACLSASCDFVGIKSKPPETYRDAVLEFLTKQNATFPNVLLNVDSDTLFAKIELASIPAVYVFGRDGKVAKRFDNDHAKSGEEFTYMKDIMPFVEKLLAE